MHFNFPRIKTNNKNGRIQTVKIQEEIHEYLSDFSDEEAIDIYHAAETLIRIHFAGRKNQLEIGILNVIAKNRKRGKY